MEDKKLDFLMFACKMPVGGDFWKAAGNIGLELQKRDLDLRFFFFNCMREITQQEHVKKREVKDTSLINTASKDWQTQSNPNR